MKSLRRSQSSSPCCPTRCEHSFIYSKKLQQWPMATTWNKVCSLLPHAVPLRPLPPLPIRIAPSLRPSVPPPEPPEPNVTAQDKETEEEFMRKKQVVQNKLSKLNSLPSSGLFQVRGPPALHAPAPMRCSRTRSV